MSERLASNQEPIDIHCFYPRRPGVGIGPTLEIFNRPPTYKLSEETRNRVLAFEHGLTNGRDLNKELVNVTDKPDVLGIEPCFRMKVNTTIFYTPYFQTPEGRKDLEQNLGLDPETKLESIEDIERHLYGVDYSVFKAKDLEAITGRSQKYIVNRMVSQFAESGYKDVSKVENPRAITVVRNPRVLAKKVVALRNLKVFLRNYKAGQLEALVDEAPGYKEAMQVVVGMHKDRVNEIIAGLYPDVENLKIQNAAAPTQVSTMALEQLKEGLSPLSIESSKTQGQFAHIDQFKYGVGKSKNQRGNYSVLSPEALALAEKSSGPILKSTNLEPNFKDVDPKIIVNADTFQAWCKLIIGENGILSEEDDTDFDPDREGPAKDGKWQVVQRDSPATLSINHQQRVLFVPRSLERSITQIAPAGGPGAATHETTHVRQRNNGEQLGLAILKDVGGARVETFAEGGAVSAETECQEIQFGLVRPTNAHYIRAAEAILAGGTAVDALLGFFDSKELQTPSEEAEDPAKARKKKADEAADRILRLYKNCGKYDSKQGYLTNSKDFVYLEQELVAAILRKLGKAHYLLIGGVEPETLAQLYDVGLVDLDKMKLHVRRPDEIIKDEIRKLIAPEAA